MAAISESDTTQKTGSFHNTSVGSNSLAGSRPRFKTGLISVPATSDDGDTITIDIWNEFGMTRFMAIDGFTESTAGSIIITEEPTTHTYGTTLVITVGGSTDNKIRNFVIYGI